MHFVCQWFNSVHPSLAPFAATRHAQFYFTNGVLEPFHLMLLSAVARISSIGRGVVTWVPRNTVIADIIWRVGVNTITRQHSLGYRRSAGTKQRSDFDFYFFNSRGTEVVCLICARGRKKTVRGET